MKLRSSKAFILTLLAGGIVITSCIKEKGLYDPEFRANNPMGNVIAPDGFDWSLMNSVKVNVEVNDEFNGQYHYLVELFDANPVISADANLLDKGVAKKGEPYSTTVASFKNNTTIHIRQTAPNGLAEVRSIEIEAGVVNCDFSALAIIEPVTSRMVTTRSASLMPPNKDDVNIFPVLTENISQLPDFSQYNGEANKSFKVTKSTMAINVQKSGVKLYVVEDVTLESDLNIASCTLYILSGVTLSLAPGTHLAQAGALISIGKDAKLNSGGKIKLNSASFFNLGVVGGTDIECMESSSLYNAGILKFLGKLSGVGAAQMINDDAIYAKNFSVSESSSITNNVGVYIEGNTQINSNNSYLWSNKGTWTTENMEITTFGNSYPFNYCKLVVFNELKLDGTSFMNQAPGTYIQCRKLYLNNSLIQLNSGTLFEITEEVRYGTNMPGKGFFARGSTKALLKIKKAIADGGVLHENLVNYWGNLHVVCDDHPVQKNSSGKIYWTISQDVSWASPANNTLAIKKTDCSDGSVITPSEPENPTYPMIVGDTNKYSILFEDHWPVYGDYDMNDIVLELKNKKLSVNEKNKVIKAELEVTLKAVGALKFVAGALRIENLPWQNISNVTYSKYKPTTFDLAANQTEAKQTFAVIPLFDDAHQLMGFTSRGFVNTIPESTTNVKERNLPTMTITIDFKNPVTTDVFSIKNLNFFIITDKAEKRKEVHVAGFPPSDLANTELFGNNDDASVAGSKDKYYISKENLTWGLIIPHQFKWPLEQTNIKNAYTDFEGWVKSGGTSNTNWWKNFKIDNVFFNELN